MSRYTPRHAPRHAHAGPRRSPLGATLRRPSVSSSLALALLATGAAGVHAAGADQGDLAAFAITPEAATQATQQTDLAAADSARFVAERASLTTTSNAVQAKQLAAERARAAALAQARREAAARAAREAQRKAIIANARSNPRAVARLMLADYGWSDSQWGCLDSLWTRESNWSYRAQNASSGAYGIPQSLPGTKMASVAADWQTNPVTQITWGLRYIKNVYGSPCSAWAHSQATGWY
jgi:hypothetical protein